MSELFLAIDPGTKKCGLALMNEKKEVFENIIVKIEHLRNITNELAEKYKFNKIILGKGTGWKHVKNTLDEISKTDIKIELLDEKYTTENAKKRGKNSSILNLIKILLDFQKQCDNIAAVIIGEKYLAKKGGEKDL